jgi:hypothetical protein
MKKISLGSWAFSFGPFADHPIPFEKTVSVSLKPAMMASKFAVFAASPEKYLTRPGRDDLVEFLKDHNLLPVMRPIFQRQSSVRQQTKVPGSVPAM